MAVLDKVRKGVGWRKRIVADHVRRFAGARDIQWARVVMDQVTKAHVQELPYRSLTALEISGEKWKDFGFASYRAAHYPEYDICNGPLEDDAFDLIIIEQVLEHVFWPFRAVRNAYKMLRPGGTLLITTPFLLRVHNYPVDCSRWTPLGLKYLLAEANFTPDNVQVGSWGNRACVKANFKGWPSWIPWLHSLKNEPEYPVVVWAFAKKDV